MQSLQLPLSAPPAPDDPTHHPAFDRLVARYRVARRIWRQDGRSRQAALERGQDQREWCEEWLAWQYRDRPIPSHLRRGLAAAHYEAAWEESGG